MFVTIVLARRNPVQLDSAAADREKTHLPGAWLVQELELKVEFSKPELDRLAGEFAAGDLCIGPAATEERRTVYFDTPEHDLHAAGLASAAPPGWRLAADGEG